MNSIMSKTETARIRQMLSYRRPARSVTEESFITSYIDTIPGVYSDSYGNRLLVEPESRVMISCHTDSVHRTEGRQAVKVSRAGMVTLAKQEKVSNCLGADDCAGVYAAIRLIEAGVKATYVFHRDEESRGRGSQWLATHYPKWLGEFDICLALDRRGTKDIITSQSWSMSASEQFAAGFARELRMGHKGAEGVFTDSANYTDLIPECSNLSVGYQYEHTSAEMLDLNYLEELIQALVRVDWYEVPVVREPGDCGYELGQGTAGYGFGEWDKWLTREVELSRSVKQ